MLSGGESKEIMKRYRILEDRSYKNLSRVFIDGFVEASIEIPHETISVDSTGTVGRMAATAVFGLTGLAGTMGKTKKQIELTGCLRASKKGLHMDSPIFDGKKYDDFFVEWGAIESFEMVEFKKFLWDKIYKKYKLQLRTGEYVFVILRYFKEVYPLTHHEFFQEFIVSFINRQIELNKNVWLAEHPPAAEQDLSWI